MVKINFIALPICFSVIKCFDTLLKSSSNCCRFTTLQSKGLKTWRNLTNNILMYFTWILRYLQKLLCKYGRTQIRIHQKPCKSSRDLLRPARSEFKFNFACRKLHKRFSYQKRKLNFLILISLRIPSLSISAGPDFFNCYLAAPRPTLEYSEGGSFTYPMFITAFELFRTEGHRELRNEVGH